MLNDLKKYGGYITNIDFNFQAGGEQSTASVTIVSEDGVYLEPELGTRFQMPFNLGFSMVITESSIVRTENSKVLQLQLVDVSIETLDMNLVLVRGEHSTGTKNDDKKTRVAEAVIYPFLELPEAAWPKRIKDKAKSLGFFERATRVPELIDGTKNIWLIGGGRCIFTPTNQIIYPILEEGFVKYRVFNPDEDKEFFLIYEDGEFKEDVSETGGDNLLNQNELIRFNASDVSIEFGYTAKQFKTLLTKFIRIKDTDGFLENDAILFKESGNLRECLSAIASKLGFFFYYDFALTQSGGSIVILGNNFINQVNNNIKNIIGNAGSKSISLSVSKSIIGVEANHVTLKGEISERKNTRDSGYSGLNNIGQSLKFKRVPVEDFFKVENPKIRKTALDDFYALFLSSAKNETTIFNDFVYGYYLNGSLIGELFDERHCALTQSVPFDPDAVHKDAKEDAVQVEGGKLDYKRIPSPRVKFDLFRRKEENEDGSLTNLTTNSPVIAPTESGLHEFLSSFYKLVFNIYISPSIPSQKAGQIEIGDGSFTVDPDPYHPNDKLKDVRALDEFVKLITDYAPFGAAIREKKVSELAQLAGQKTLFPNSDAVGTRMYFIGFRNVGSSLGVRTQVEQIEDEKIGQKVDLLVSKNLVSHQYGESTFLIAQKEFDKNCIKPIKELSERLWKEFREDTKNALSIAYRRKNSEDKDFDFDFDEDSIAKPDKYSINHFTDRRVGPKQLIEKVSHVYINGPKKDIDQFYANVANGSAANSIIPYIEGPLYTAEIRYFRGPEIEDFNLQKGISSVHVDIAEDGIVTTINYSSRKFFTKDQEVLILENRIAKNISSIPNAFPAHRKNFLRL